LRRGEARHMSMIPGCEKQSGGIEASSIESGR
jgi:hypothetical protein